MPLNKSCSKDAFKQNVAELVKAGHTQDQAVAIAAKTLREACGEAKADSMLASLRAADDLAAARGAKPTCEIQLPSDGALRVGRALAMYDHHQPRGDCGAFDAGDGDNATHVVKVVRPDGATFEHETHGGAQHARELASTFEKVGYSASIRVKRKG